MTDDALNHEETWDTDDEHTDPDELFDDDDWDDEADDGELDLAQRHSLRRPAGVRFPSISTSTGSHFSASITRSGAEPSRKFVPYITIAELCRVANMCGEFGVFMLMRRL